MKLEVTNKNYCATVVQLSKFVSLVGCDNIKAALIFGNSVIVGKDTQEGDVGLFFPVETQLSQEFLGANNLFRKPEWGNVDPTKKGFFEEHGRIKAVKFRGHKSEGFFIPLNSLSYVTTAYNTLSLSAAIGYEFDKLDDKEICRKYVPKRNPGSQRILGPRKARKEDRLVENQFRLHTDTENLRRNIHKISPADYISISEKWHGTSAVVANVLIKRNLKWYERALMALGVKVQDTQYGLTWSSRRVIKGVEDALVGKEHFYTSDVWGAVAQEIGELVPQGYSIYGEIVGYTPDGSSIQPGYHYGCIHKQHRFLVYRVTQTNPQGKVIELSWPQMKEFCEKLGLEMVKELWYGQVQNYIPGSQDVIDSEGNWHTILLSQLEHEYIKEDMCSHNNYEVPTEGICVRVDRLDSCDTYKLKTFTFFEWESKALDRGEIDIETAESEVSA